ncbi:MAG: hypothetical protein ACKOQ1_03520, partial [Actinomycetota bacterium]
ASIDTAKTAYDTGRTTSTAHHRGQIAAGTLLFTRPVQRLVLTRLLGARTPTADETDVLGRAWRVVAQATHVPARR